MTFFPEDSGNYSNVSTEVTINVVALTTAGDEDNDGLSNNDEATLGTNPYLRDTDNDGVNDLREVGDGTDPLDPASFDPLNLGLVAYYPFNGNAKDESGNGNNGTVFGAQSSTDRFGAAEQAFRFDGEDDFIEVLDSLSLRPASALTLSIWFYSETPQTYRRLVTKGLGPPVGHDSYAS